MKKGMDWSLEINDEDAQWIRTRLTGYSSCLMVIENQPAIDFYTSSSHRIYPVQGKADKNEKSESVFEKESAGDD
jgi:hypothetical protein